MPSVPFCARVTLNPSLESSSSRPSRISTSSSTMRMSPLLSDGLNGVLVISSGAHRLPFGGSGSLGERQFDAELGAAAGAVGNLDGTTVFLNDSVCHRQPQSGALARGLGGEERVVDAVQMLGGDACSAVGHFDMRVRAFLPGADLDRPAGAHGVARVEDQVEKHLLQLAGVAVD